jgi:hypothetical protein
MKTVKLQAREIVRAAKRMGVEMRRGSPSRCAKGVAKQLHGIDPLYFSDESLAKKLNLSVVDIAALEMGFEDWPAGSVWFKDVTDKQLRNIHKNRYHKVGKRVAELAGV